MNSPSRSRKKNAKPIKTQFNCSQEEAAKLRLIELSQNQFTGKDSSEKFSIFLDTNADVPSRSPQQTKTQNSSRNTSNLISMLPKSYVSAQFHKDRKRDCQNLRDLSRDQFQSAKSSSSYRSNRVAEVLVRSPVSLSHYLVTGAHSAERTSSSAPKSEYIIRQRRNCKKLKRIKEKRSVEQSETHTGIFDRLVLEREAHKVLNMKTMFLAHKLKGGKFDLESRHELAPK